MLLMIIELIVVLLALYVGSRYGSLALGAISGIGLVILVFGFGLKPGTPPTDVIYIIIAAVTCAGIMQASGGRIGLFNWPKNCYVNTLRILHFMHHFAHFS